MQNVFAVQNEWPSGTQFTFNCFRHWATMVVRNTEDRSDHLLHSREGMTHGDPLALIIYGIGVSLLSESSGAHTLASPSHGM